MTVYITLHMYNQKDGQKQLFADDSRVYIRHDAIEGYHSGGALETISTVVGTSNTRYFVQESLEDIEILIKFAHSMARQNPDLPYLTVSHKDLQS